VVAKVVHGKNKKEINNKMIKTLINFAVRFNQNVFEEDRAINENIQFGKEINKSNIFTYLEERVKKFRNLTNS